jgi:hypothetical protein
MQASPLPDQPQCFDRAADLGVWCRCVSAAVGWLQGVRRLFAACRDQVWLVRNDLGTVMVEALAEGRDDRAGAAAWVICG